jgi:hypothetical protein
MIYVVPTQPAVEPGSDKKPKAYAMTWAQRLKRVFAIDIETGQTRKNA